MNAVSLMVLWVFFTAPWEMGAAPMTSGWASVAVLDESACEEAMERAVSLGKKAQCLASGIEPSPLAQQFHKE